MRQGAQSCGQFHCATLRRTSDSCTDQYLHSWGTSHSYKGEFCQHSYYPIYWLVQLWDNDGHAVRRSVLHWILTARHCSAVVARRRRDAPQALSDDRRSALRLEQLIGGRLLCLGTSQGALDDIPANKCRVEHSREDTATTAASDSRLARCTAFAVGRVRRERRQ